MMDHHKLAASGVVNRVTLRVLEGDYDIVTHTATASLIIETPEAK